MYLIVIALVGFVLGSLVDLCEAKEAWVCSCHFGDSYWTACSETPTGCPDACTAAGGGYDTFGVNGPVNCGVPPCTYTNAACFGSGDVDCYDGYPRCDGLIENPTYRSGPTEVGIESFQTKTACVEIPRGAKVVQTSCNVVENEGSHWGTCNIPQQHNSCGAVGWFWATRYSDTCSGKIRRICVEGYNQKHDRMRWLEIRVLTK